MINQRKSFKTKYNRKDHQYINISINLLEDAIKMMTEHNDIVNNTDCNASSKKKTVQKDLQKQNNK